MRECEREKENECDLEGGEIMRGGWMPCRPRLTSTPPAPAAGRGPGGEGFWGGRVGGGGERESERER